MMMNAIMNPSVNPIPIMNVIVIANVIVIVNDVERPWGPAAPPLLTPGTTGAGPWLRQRLPSGNASPDALQAPVRQFQVL